MGKEQKRYFPNPIGRFSRAQKIGALRAEFGNITKAALRLGVARKTFHDWLRADEGLQEEQRVAEQAGIELISGNYLELALGKKETRYYQVTDEDGKVMRDELGNPILEEEVFWERMPDYDAAKIWVRVQEMISARGKNKEGDENIAKPEINLFRVTSYEDAELFKTGQFNLAGASDIDHEDHDESEPQTEK